MPKIIALITISVCALLAFLAGWWSAPVLFGPSDRPLAEEAAPAATAPAPTAPEPVKSAAGGPLSTLDLPRGEIRGSPTLGASAPKVTLVMLTVPTCSESRESSASLARLLDENRETLQLVWKVPPPDDETDDEVYLAALAAHRQGRFWEIHDLLAASPPDDLSTAAIAKSLSLNAERFAADLDDPMLRNQLKREQQAALAIGVETLPAFFLNGQKLKGARPYRDFANLMGEALLFAEQALEAGTPRAALHETLARRLHPAGRLFHDLMIEAREVQPAAARPAGRKPVVHSFDEKVHHVPIDPAAPTRGASQPIVHMVLFADFACPFSKRLAPTLKHALATFPEDLELVWYNLPAPDDERAHLAAQAAMAAHGVGRFWDLHALLFANQDALESADIERYAAELGLDLAVLRRALETGVHRARVERDVALAERIGVQATPRMFINGRSVLGARTFAEIEPLIREELAKAERLLSRGAARRGVYEHIMRRAAAAP